MDADKDEDCRATRVSAFVIPNMLEVDVSHEPEKLKSWSTKLPAQKVRTRNQASEQSFMKLCVLRRRALRALIFNDTAKENIRNTQLPPICFRVNNISSTMCHRHIIQCLTFLDWAKNGPPKVVRKFLQPHTIAVLGQQQQSTANVVVHVQSNQQRQRYV